MKLTTKGRFAVTAMVDLALHLSEAPVRIALIAERQNLSVAYLEQIFCKLRRAGLVTDMVRRNEERAARKEAHVSADIPVRRRN